MADLIHPKNGCCSGGDCSNSTEEDSRAQPLFVDIPSNEVCCGSAPGPQSSPFSTGEVVRCIDHYMLKNVVRHNQLI